MEIAILIFILSFLVIVTTLVVSATRYMCEQKSKVKFKEEDVEVADHSWLHQKEVNETQEKWKLTFPKHSTRIKLREARKLRNKRKGHGKGVRGKKK